MHRQIHGAKIDGTNAQCCLDVGVARTKGGGACVAFLPTGQTGWITETNGHRAQTRLFPSAPRAWRPRTHGTARLPKRSRHPQAMGRSHLKRWAGRLEWKEDTGLYLGIGEGFGAVQTPGPFHVSLWYMSTLPSPPGDPMLQR